MHRGAHSTRSPRASRADSKEQRLTQRVRPSSRPAQFTYPSTSPPRAVQLQRNAQLTVFKFTRSLQVRLSRAGASAAGRGVALAA